MTETGHKKELSDASTKLAEAITAGDLEALRSAASDHATALNSQATAMAASIAAPLYTQMGDISAQIKQLAEIVTNARQHDLNWRTDERLRRDKQSDRLYEELDKLLAAAEANSARLGKHSLELEALRQGQAAYNARLDADEARLDRKRLELDQIKRELAELKAWREAQERGGHAE